MEDSKAEGRQAMKVSLACAVQAKNATVSRRGMSAHALVFGRQAYLPELLDEEVWQAASMGQSLSTEGEIARQAEMRAAAKVALLREKNPCQKLKRALRRAPAGGPARSYYPGEMIRQGQIPKVLRQLERPMSARRSLEPQARRLGGFGQS